MLPSWLKHRENLPARVTQNPGSVLASIRPNSVSGTRFLCLLASLSLRTVAAWQPILSPNGSSLKPRKISQLISRKCDQGLVARTAPVGSCCLPEAVAMAGTLHAQSVRGLEQMLWTSPPALAPPTSSCTGTLSPESSVSPAKPSFPPARQDRRTEEFA